jgi:hypothetical protein
VLDRLKLEIIKGAYQEHYKYFNDICFYLPLTDPKRKMIEQEVEKLRIEMNELEKKIKK